MLNDMDKFNKNITDVEIEEYNAILAYYNATLDSKTIDEDSLAEIKDFCQSTFDSFYSRTDIDDATKNSNMPILVDSLVNEIKEKFVAK